MKTDDYLLDMLLKLRLVTSAQISETGDCQREEGVVDLLLKGGQIKPLDVLEALATHWGCEMVYLKEDQRPTFPVLNKISREQALKFRVVPLDFGAGGFVFATDDPSNLTATSALQDLTGLQVVFKVTTTDDLNWALGDYYHATDREITASLTRPVLC